MPGPYTLPDYPGGTTVDQGDGHDFTLYPNYETGHGYTTGIPQTVFSPGSAVADLLEEVAYSPLPSAKLGDPIPLVYGRRRLGGQIARAKRWLGELLVLVVWSEGEIEEIERVLSDNDDITVGTSYAHYTGTTSQTGDPTIAARYGQADDLPGIAYSVLSLPVGTSLKLQADVKGKKVYDPREDDVIYSSNAALCLADFIDTYTDYEVDWALAEVAADYCDEIIDEDNEIPRWHIGVAFKEPKAPDDYIQVLVEYANCYVFIDAGVAKIIPDQARSPDHTIGSGQFEEGTVRIRKSGQRNVPTQVICWYTIPDDEGDWTEVPASTDDPEIDVPLRIEELRMPGYQHKIQAQRKAIQNLNYANLSDLEVEFSGFDRSAEIARGDVISFTTALGLTNKQLRVLDPRRTGKGSYSIFTREHSDLIYSEVVVEDDDPPDTDLPPVNQVPTPTNLVLAEELYQMTDGLWRSRLRATVTAVVFPFDHRYEWTVIQGGVTIHTALTHSPLLVWGPLPIDGGVTWLVRCRVIGPVNAGSHVQGSIDIQGKLLPPLPPTSFTVLEASGVVYFSWMGGADIDLRGFEIRYGAVGTPWTSMNVVNRWGIAVAGESNQIPVGTWDFEIRSFDSVRTPANPVGQYSTTGLRRQHDVTSDAASFHIGTFALEYDATDSENLIEINGTYWTDAGESWLDVFGTGPMSNFPDPVSVYQSDVASKWVSESIDLGQVLTVNIIAETVAEDVGTPTEYEELTGIDDEPLLGIDSQPLLGSTEIEVASAIDIVIETREDEMDLWTRHMQSSVLTSARYIRVSIECPATSRMKVPPDYGTLRADVIAHELSGEFTTDGINPTTVSLGVAVARFTYINATSIGSDTLAVIEDVIVGDPGTFDVIVLDTDTNAQVAGSGYWHAKYY